MRKILVTGGAGFIGSAVIRHIIQHTPDAVVNVDKLTYAGNLESLIGVAHSPRYHFAHLDICDRAGLDALLAEHQPDAVMHLAAESHVDRSIYSPAEFINTNIVGTYTLLEAVRNYWNMLSDQHKTAFRFHHISTDEVYGDLHGTDDLSSETTPYAPSSPYSASKASSDHLVRAWQRTYGLPVLISNCSNNYGPYHFPEKLIPLVILNALEGKPLPVYGKGDHIRDWLYVEDHARGLYEVITRGEVGETYNIGGHNEKTNLVVVHTICELLEELVPEHPNSLTYHRHSRTSTCHSREGANLPRDAQGFKGLITHIEDRPGHDLRYAIDATKIEQELDWTPQETFESGIRKTVQWYLDNQEWVNNVKNGAYQSWVNQHYKADQ